MADFFGTEVNDDWIYGGNGNDILFGKTGGGDVFRPEIGNDIIGGGNKSDEANDWVDYRSTTSDDPHGGITVDLSDKYTKHAATTGSDVDLNVVDVVSGVGYVDNINNIEHVMGSNGDDDITGDELDNRIGGYAGDDTLDGGAGTDTAVYEGDLEDYTITRSGDTLTVTDNRGFWEVVSDASGHFYLDEGTDTLTNFEKFQFNGVEYDLADILPDDYADLVGDLSEPYGSVPMGSKAEGEIEQGWDSDIFSVTLDAGTEYRFYMNGADTFDGTLSDPYLRVYTSSGSLEWDAIDNDSGEGSNAYISYTPTSSGTYYLQAWGYTSSETGTYTLIAKSGADDYLVGSSEGDYYWGGDGADTIYGGDGGDHLYGDAGNDEIHGGDGADRIEGWYGHDWIDGGEGYDVIYGNDGHDTIYGGESYDDLYGGNGNDVLKGEEGSDYLYGDSGNDDLAGGDGNDLIYGGNGNDKVYGGNDDDSVYGDAGNDTVSGGAGNDNVSGNDGNDSLYGDDGHDDIAGGDGRDKIWSGNGNDTAYGGNGNDKVWGDDGNDIVYGGAGNDYVIGGKHDDTLYGNKGQDRLYAGGGKDHLWGGDHADVFVFGKSHGKNWIEDFENGSDRIEITKGASDYGDLTVTDIGDDVKIAWANTTVILEDTKWSDIGAGDFIFS